jgi:hypothetical protein
MPSKRLLAILALAAAPLMGSCNDEGGRPCDRCSNDGDCQSGLTCQQFTTPSTGNTFLACANQDPNMTCPGQ